MRADIVKIMTPIGFFLISGLFLPATHIVSVLVNWGRRRRKSVLGLRETQWWGILGAFLIVLVSLSFIASWAVGGSLRERAATAGYIECDGIFDRLERGRAYTTYALSADLCRQAGFKRSRIERDFDTPRPSG